MEVLLNPPAPIVAELIEDGFDGAGEGVVAVVGRDQDAIVSESNDVAGSETGEVGDETDVFFHTPPCVVTVVLDRVECLNLEVVTEYNDSVLPEAHDIGTAGFHGGD